jgi:hypothetical protein
VPDTVATAVSLDLKLELHVTSKSSTAIKSVPPKVAVATTWALWYIGEWQETSANSVSPATMVSNVESDRVIAVAVGYHTRRFTACEYAGAVPIVTVMVTTESPLV